VEHLGRATVDFVDALVIVVEPTRRSLGTAAQIQKLAHDIALKQMVLVGNKVRGEDDLSFLLTNSLGIPLIGALPANPAVQDADRMGVAVYDYVPELRAAAEEIRARLMHIEEAAL
ncbi:MAG: carbon monoxide dehydrogenase, partial [Candidatus Promineifilaceae bacterium]